MRYLLLWGPILVKILLFIFHQNTTLFASNTIHFAIIFFFNTRTNLIFDDAIFGMACLPKLKGSVYIFLCCLPLYFFAVAVNLFFVLPVNFFSIVSADFSFVISDFFMVSVN